MSFTKNHKFGYIELHKPNTQSIVSKLLFGENRRPSLPYRMAQFEYSVEGGLKPRTTHSISPRRIMLGSMIGVLPFAWWLNISNASYETPVSEKSQLIQNTLPHSNSLNSSQASKPAILPELVSHLTVSDLITESNSTQVVQSTTETQVVKPSTVMTESKPAQVVQSTVETQVAKLPTLMTESQPAQILQNTIAPSPLETAVKPIFSPWLHINIQSGDTLSTIFEQHHLNKTELQDILAINKNHADLLRQLQLDQTLRIERDESGNVSDMWLVVDFAEMLHVYKEGNKFASQLEKKNAEIKTILAGGVIESALFVDGHKAGLTDRLIITLKNIFSGDIDVRNVKVGDKFKVLYEKHIFQSKEEEGNVLAAEFIHRGKTYRAVRYTDKAGKTSYYTPDGQNLQERFLKVPVETTKTVYVDTPVYTTKKVLVDKPVYTTKKVYVDIPIHKTKTLYLEEEVSEAEVDEVYSGSGSLIVPVQYRELSSHYGKHRGRKGRVHQGVDYAAPSGTPIMASADATVSFVGVKNGYGKMVILQHDKRHETIYAHMSSYAQGLSAGQRVKQGKIIGYVGRTGRATGDHLHYEFRVDGISKNPVSAKLPSSGKAPVKVAKNTTKSKKMVEKTVKTTEYVKKEKSVKTTEYVKEEKMVKTTEYVKKEKIVKVTEYVKTENIVKDKQDFIKQTQPILAQLEKAHPVAAGQPSYESKLAQAISATH